MTMTPFHDSIPGEALEAPDPRVLARINAAYPSPLYHLQELLPSHAVPDHYVAGFRVPALEDAIAATLDAACVEERVARDLSRPMVDARDRDGRKLSESAFTLVHDPGRGWQVLAARPIAAGDGIGNYWGEISHCEGLGEEPPGVLRDSIRGFFDRLFDSHPGADRLSPAARRALEEELRQTVAEFNPYGFQITLPRPGSPPILLLVDGLKRSTICRFMNHAEAPNVDRVFIRDARDGTAFVRVAFFAARDIAVGEELVYHYGHGESVMPVDHERMRSVHEIIVRAIEAAAGG